MKLVGINFNSQHNLKARSLTSIAGNTENYYMCVTRVQGVR
jgi:hypothetical protein